MMMELFDKYGVCPLRVRSIEETRHQGHSVFFYTLTPSLHQGELMRDREGADSLQVNTPEIKFATAHRLLNCGVGDYFQWNLTTFHPIEEPVAEPGSGIAGLLQQIFYGATRANRDEPVIVPEMPVDMDEDLATHTQDYITGNYLPDEWQRMNHDQRAAAIARARAQFIPTPAAGEVFARGNGEVDWEKLEGEREVEDLVDDMRQNLIRDDGTIVGGTWRGRAEERAAHDRHPSVDHE